MRVVAAATTIAFAAALALVPSPASAGALDLPDLDRAIHYKPKQPLRVLTADGVEIATFGTERRRFVPIDKIPKRLQDAVIAVEDARFREHTGIDAKSIARAAAAALTGGMRQGASTITQQVARTMFLTQAPTAERKAQEIRIALELETRLSKDKILEIYMNEIWLGRRAWGFAEASRQYFGKPMDKLSIAEAAMLAGLPQNPQYANPIADVDRAIKRQRHVLDRMRATGVINDAQLAAARAEKLVIAPPDRDPVRAGHVAEMARLAVVDRFGIDAAYTRGITVTTSLRAADQRAAWGALRRGVLAHDRKGAWRGVEGVVELPAADAAEDAAVDAAKSAAASKGASNDAARDASSDATKDPLNGASKVASKDPLKDALKGHRDDDMLRAAVVLSASPKALRARLADGERIVVDGEGLAWVRSALTPRAKAPLRIERGAVIRVTKTAKGWQIVQWPQAEGAFVALDPHTARVRALVGGFDFGRQPFNHVTQGWRQAGSAIKPLVYSAALEHGVMPGTVIDDAPIVVPNVAVAANGTTSGTAGGTVSGTTTGTPGGTTNTSDASWSPVNSDGAFLGPITLRDALAQSRNTVSVRVLQHTGVAAAREWMQRFGIDAAKQPANFTLSLGTGSVTPLQLAQAYAVIANGGVRVDPVVIERISDADGKPLFEAAKPAPPPSDGTTRAIPARNAWLTASLLNDVTKRGTAARAQVQLKRADVYGKTGTTDAAVDAWFAGFQPSLVAVAWVGYDVPRSLGASETGGDLALPIWIDFMSAALKGVPIAKPATPPPGLTRHGSDWIYDEYAVQGHVQRIGADGQVQRAQPFAASDAGAGAAVPQDNATR